MSDEENMGKLWGEIPPEPETLQLTEMEKNTFLDIIMAMYHSIPPVEGREMFIPPQSPATTVRYTTECKDYISLHNIKLQLFIDDMEKRIETASIMEFDDEASAMAELPPAPELPPMHENCILHKKRPGDLTGRDLEKSDFVKGIGEAPPFLPMYAIRRQLEVALSAFLGNIGFTTSKQSAFDFFSDVLLEWLRRVTKLLRLNVDREALTGDSVCCDVLERTLIESGISGGYASLIDYYQESILGRHDTLLQKSKSLVEQYEKFRHPVIEPEGEDIVDKLDVADGVEFPDVPIDEDDVLQQVPFEYEELQGALQNNPPEGSNLLKGDNWPPHSTKNDFLADGVASGSRNSSISQDIFVHSLESTVQSLESTEPMSLPSEVPTDTRSYAKRDSNKKLKTS